MSKTTIKLKIMQLVILNKGKIIVQHSLEKKSYILETNMYYGDIKLPKNVKMINIYGDSYRGESFFKLEDTISGEHLASIICSSKKDLNKSLNRNSVLKKIIDLNNKNVSILQISPLSFVLDSQMDIEQIKVPEGVKIKIDLYGPNDEVQCKILDVNDKQLGVLNCKYLKKNNKTK